MPPILAHYPILKRHPLPPIKNFFQLFLESWMTTNMAAITTTGRKGGRLPAFPPVMGRLHQYLEQKSENRTGYRIRYTTHPNGPHYSQRGPPGAVVVRDVTMWHPIPFSRFGTENFSVGAYSTPERWRRLVGQQALDTLEMGGRQQVSKIHILYITYRIYII